MVTTENPDIHCPFIPHTYESIGIHTVDMKRQLESDYDSQYGSHVFTFSTHKILFQTKNCVHSHSPSNFIYFKTCNTWITVTKLKINIKKKTACITNIFHRPALL